MALSKKQKKIARVAEPRNKITSADFKKLRENKGGKVVGKKKTTSVGKKKQTKRPKGSPIPSNPSLYARVKSEAKKKFKVYPSAYANAWLVRTYKKRGGGYK